MDHLILTMGRNEVPVLVAAYRLCALGELPKIAVLHSKETSAEAERVRRALEERLRADGALKDGKDLEWHAFEVDEAGPPGIRRSVAGIVSRALSPGRNDYRFHLHHTGGTTAMGVYALQALLECQHVPGNPQPRFHCESSYLSGKNQQVRTDGGEILTPAQSDERHAWNLTVEELAKLHGYAAACKTEPVQGLLAVSQTMSAILLDAGHAKQYDNWLRCVWERQRAQMIWPEIYHPEWQRVTEQVAAALHPETRWLTRDHGRWLVDRSVLAKRPLRHVDEFLHHQCLELFAFQELRAALADLMPDTTPHIRHSMHAQQPGKKDHEVDVVAVCGYQLLAVSCSFAADFSKLKAFEVIHRARQIGGSHARAIVVCTGNPAEAERTTDELRDDVASPEYFVEIWGRDKIERPAALRAAFRNYLSETMNWCGVSQKPVSGAQSN